VNALARMLVVALLAGVCAGAAASVVQTFRVTPLIAAAEALEEAPQQPAAGQSSAEHEHVPGRSAYTVLFNVLAGIGFALLLTAGYSAAGSVTWRLGLAWGLAGFAAFFAAPALGLPPSLPGADLPGLSARQTWWIGTALATALGLLPMLLARRLPWWLAGVALIALPHLIGPPVAAGSASAIPAPLQRSFVVCQTVQAIVFWLVLGAVSGWLCSRISGPAPKG